MTERRARRKPGENRALLLQAGLNEFGLYGYHGTSTARIAARAGVPQPHVYANFSGKPQLFFACLERAGELLESAPIDDDLGDAATLLMYQAIAALHDPDHGPQVRTLLAAGGFLERERRDALVLAAAALLTRAALEAPAREVS